MDAKQVSEVTGLSAQYILTLARAGEIPSRGENFVLSEVVPEIIRYERKAAVDKYIVENTPPPT
jgi:hypothetical protein